MGTRAGMNRLPRKKPHHTDMLDYAAKPLTQPTGLPPPSSASNPAHQQKGLVKWPYMDMVASAPSNKSFRMGTALVARKSQRAGLTFGVPGNQAGIPGL